MPNNNFVYPFDTKLQKIVNEAIDDMDDKKLDGGVYLRGDVGEVKCYINGSKSQLDHNVRLDNEREVRNRPDGPFFKLVCQGCAGGAGSIGVSTAKRNGTGPQYATVLVHHSFNKKTPPKASTIKDCLRSSAANCGQKIDDKNYTCMTVVIHENGAWINEVTGEVGNIPEGVAPPQKVVEVEEDPKDKDKGKKPKGGKQRR